MDYISGKLFTRINFKNDITNYGFMKKALITGISGQDGSYLSEFLLEKNYEVHGIIRRVALEDETHRLWRLRNIRNKIKLINNF